MKSNMLNIRIFLLVKAVYALYRNKPNTGKTGKT